MERTALDALKMSSLQTLLMYEYFSGAMVTKWCSSLGRSYVLD